MTTKLEKGKINYSVFSMPEFLKKCDLTMLREQLTKYGFRPLLKEDSIDRTCGFCDINDWLDNEHFSNLLLGSYYVFGIRFDEYKISKSDCKIYVDQICKEKGLTLKELTRQGKLEIFEAAKKKVKSQSMPKTKVIEVVVDLATEKIYVFTKSMRVLADILDKLEKTFLFGDGEQRIKYETKARTITDSEKLTPEHFLINLFNTAKNNGEISVVDDILTILNDCEIDLTSGEAGTTYKIKSNQVENESVVENTLGEGGFVNKLKLRIIKGQQDYSFMINTDRCEPESVLLPIFGKEDADTLAIERITSLITLDLYMRAIVAKIINLPVFVEK